jgi:anaerobic nitric oxide reductase transcription regulator
MCTISSSSSWPGNVRELENVVARAVLRAAAGGGSASGGVTIAPAHLDVSAAAGDSPDKGARERDENGELPFRDRVAAFERRLIAEAVDRHGGNWAAAARSLGMHRSNLHHLATRLGLR